VQLAVLAAVISVPRALRSALPRASRTRMAARAGWAGWRIVESSYVPLMVDPVGSTMRMPLPCR